MRRRKQIAWVAALAVAAALFGQIPVLGEAGGIQTREAQPAVTQIPGTTREIREFDASFLSLTGYALSGGEIHDRSQYVDSDSYRKVTDETQFLRALMDARDGSVKVIEVAADMNLGWHEIGEEGQQYSCIQPYANSLTSAIPVGNPMLIETGISELLISNTHGLTIFSTEGYHIRHVELKLQESSSDIVIRNLDFDETYEWDDWRDSTGGGNGYAKRTGWSYVKINGAKNVWIDHCNFSIAYDGMIDVENGSNGVTVSWCKFGVQDFSNESMIYKTMTYLEKLYQENYNDSFHIYRIMRDNGMSMEDVMAYGAYHKKVHLMGGGDKDYETNVDLRLTMAYNTYKNMGSRLPMLRAGSAHLMNCWFDNTAFSKIAEKMQRLDVRSKIEADGGYVHFLARGINPLQGGSVGADTCVYEDFHSCMYGSNSGGNGIIVNSSFSCGEYDEEENLKELVTYEGSSWDNGGKNYFTYYDDLGFDYDNGLNYKWNDPGGTLPYEYQVVPLDETKTVLETYGGAGVVDMTAAEWLKTSYDRSVGVTVYDKNEKVAVTGLSLSAEEKTMEVGDLFQLTGTVSPARATDQSLLWESSDPSVAEVGKTGLVYCKDGGSAVITARTADGGFAASCQITAIVSVKGIQLPEKLTISVGDQYQLEPVLTPGQADSSMVVWASSNTGVVSVDENGMLTAHKTGRATISCRSAEDRSIRDTCSVTVEEKTAGPSESPMPSEAPEPSKEPEPSESAKPSEGPEPSKGPEPSESPMPSQEPAGIPGDADGSGTVNADDALRVLQHVVKLHILDEKGQRAADVDGRAGITADDALTILRYVVKLVGTLSNETKI